MIYVIIVVVLCIASLIFIGAYPEYFVYPVCDLINDILTLFGL